MLLFSEVLTITATFKLTKRQKHTQCLKYYSGWLCIVVPLFWGNRINCKYMGTVYAGKYLVVQQVKYMWILHNVNFVKYTARAVLSTQCKWYYNYLDTLLKLGK